MVYYGRGTGDVYGRVSFQSGSLLSRVAQLCRQRLGTCLPIMWPPLISCKPRGRHDMSHHFTTFAPAHGHDMRSHLPSYYVASPSSHFLQASRPTRYESPLHHFCPSTRPRHEVTNKIQIRLSKLHAFPSCTPFQVPTTAALVHLRGPVFKPPTKFKHAFPCCTPFHVARLSTLHAFPSCTPFQVPTTAALVHLRGPIFKLLSPFDK